MTPIQKFTLTCVIALQDYILVKMNEKEAEGLIINREVIEEILEEIIKELKAAI